MEDGRVMALLGPKMCEELCMHTCGCSAYAFSTSHLICEVTHLELQTSPWKHIANPLTNKILEPESCPLYSKIILSHAGKLCCRRRIASMQDESGVRSTLLVTPFMAFKKQPVFELSLPDSYMQRSVISPKKVRCLLYIANSRRLLFFLYLKSDVDVGVIASLNLDNSTTYVIRTRLECRDMLLDWERNMIVLVISEPRSAIYSMSTDGRNLTFLFHPTDQPDTSSERTSVAMDVEKGLIYVCVPTRIVVADAEGKNLKVVYHGEMLSGISFDPFINALYFGTNTYVKRLLLPDSQPTTLFSLEEGQIPVRVVYHKNYVYIACLTSDKLFRYYLRLGAGRNESLHAISMNGHVRNWIFCIMS